MPPLLKPIECTVLILDSAGEPGELDRDVTAGRRRILRAAALCGVPTFQAAREPSHAPDDGGPASTQAIYNPPMPGSPWAETPLGLALAKTSRTSLLISGYGRYLFLEKF